EREPMPGLLSRVSSPTISRLIEPSIDVAFAPPPGASNDTWLIALSTRPVTNFVATMPPRPAIITSRPSTSVRVAHHGVRRFVRPGPDGYGRLVLDPDELRGGLPPEPPPEDPRPDGPRLDELPPDHAEPAPPP